MRTKIMVRICSLAVAGSLALSLAGCGGKNVGSVNGDEESQTKKIKIRLWQKPQADATQGVQEVYETWMAKVKEKFPYIEIEDETIRPGTDYRQQYDKAIMAGEGPTVIDCMSYTDIPTRIKNGTIADISDLVNNWDMKKQNKVITQFDEAISTKDGKWYAIPTGAYLLGTLYNTKSILEGGGDPNVLPKTWKEFGELGQKLTDVKKPRFGYELMGMEWNAWAFTPWVWSAGGEMVRANGDGTYKIAFNEEPGIDAALFWNEMVWKYKMTQKDVLQDMNKLEADIKSGRACFAWKSVAGLKQEELTQYDLKISDFGFIPFPVKDESIKNPTFTGGEVVTFNPKATKEEIKAAWDVMTCKLYDEEVLTEVWKVNEKYDMAELKAPARNDLYEKKLSFMKSVSENVRRDFVIASQNTKIEPFCPNWSDLKTALVPAIQKIILTENIQREQAKEIFDNCADNLYKKFPDSFRK